MNELSIIIVSWNCKHYVFECLRTIYETSQANNYTIILVDNNSSDNTIEEVKEKFSKIVCISNSTNVGFASANNQALMIAKSRLVLFLNPDTLVHKNALLNMIEYLSRNLQIAAIGPKILNHDGSTQYTGVRFPSNWNLFCETFFLDRIFPRSKIVGTHKALYENYDAPFEVDYVQGSALMIRKDILDQVGFFDTQYFMYFEETDLCYRIKESGERIHYFPYAQITHFGGNEFGHFTEKRLLYYHESLFLFYKKHYSALRRIGLACIIAVRSSIRIMLWTLQFPFKRSMHKRIVSIIVGYCKVYKLLFRNVV